MNSPARPDPSLSPVLINLMKGVLYREQQPRLWQDLLNLEAAVRDYLAVIGLTLDLDEGEGYAFLRQVEPEAEGVALPRLVARRALSYPVSLLLVLLRKRLLEGDASSGDTRTVITQAEIVERIAIFLPAGSNEAKLADQVGSHINKVVELGFLRELNESGTYEIRRILKAFVDAQWLGDFEEKLQSYRDHALTRN